MSSIWRVKQHNRNMRCSQVEAARPSAAQVTNRPAGIRIRMPVMNRRQMPTEFGEPIPARAEKSATYPTHRRDRSSRTPFNRLIFKEFGTICIFLFNNRHFPVAFENCLGHIAPVAATNGGHGLANYPGPVEYERGEL